MDINIDLYQLLDCIPESRVIIWGIKWKALEVNWPPG